MIRFEHLSKTFQTKDGAFEALKDVSFEIEKAEVYRHPQGLPGYEILGRRDLDLCPPPGIGPFIGHSGGDGISAAQSVRRRRCRRGCHGLGPAPVSRIFWGCHGYYRRLHRHLPGLEELVYF
mgnify:CR=1 FL=1